MTREATVVIGERTYRIREVTEFEANLHEMMFGWHLRDADGGFWIPVDSTSSGRWVLHHPTVARKRPAWLERPDTRKRLTALGGIVEVPEMVSRRWRRIELTIDGQQMRELKSISWD